MHRKNMGSGEAAGTTPRGMDGAISRRSFLVMCTAACALSASGCGLFGHRPPSTKQGGPFALWEQMRAAVRTSPDHVAAAAARAVKTRDAAAIFTFVRDEIIAYPPAGTEQDLVSSVRWGVRGTLRGGAGTPRDKVEVLADLYRQAGFEAEVVSGTLAPQINLADLFRPVQRRFDPQLSSTTVKSWQDAGARTGPVPAKDLDPGNAQSQRLAQQILATLPSGQMSAAPDLPYRSVPLVRVTVNGKSSYANPLVPKATFGNAYTVATPDPAGPAESPTNVAVRLQAATTQDPSNPITLVEHTYSAADLVGRRLHVAFGPTIPIEVLAHLNVRDLQTFLPILSVSGPDLDADTTAKLSATGPAISLGGDIIDVNNGAATVNGQPVAVPANPDPHAADRIASLAVDVASQTFPIVRLRVSALDSTGRPIEGLPASALRLKEDGAGVSFAVSANQVPPPRVMLIVDRSASISSGPDPVEFARTLAQRLFATHPEAAIQVTGVSSGLSAREDGFTLRDAASVAAAVKPLTSLGSAIWWALADANRAHPTVIVILSDFDPDDDPNSIPALEQQVAAGAPVVAIGVGKVNTTVRDRITNLAGGVATVAQNLDQSVRAAADYLQRRQGQPYLLTYRALPTGPQRRTLVLVTAKGVSAQATYTVPTTQQQAQAPAWAGIYLSLTIGDEPVITRVLAGTRRRSSFDTSPVLQSDLDDVRGLFYGSVMLSFEGAAPSMGTWIDDLLTAKLGWKPFWDAAFAADQGRIVQALAGGLPQLPSALPGLHPSITGAGELTYETGLRCVLYVDQPRFGKGRLRRTDVLRSTRWNTWAADPTRAFQLNLERSAFVALAEAATFPNSTLSILKGKALTAFPPGSVSDSQLGFVPTDQRDAWVDLLNDWSAYHRVVPAGGTPLAFWAVDPGTGSLLGVLADGSGGSFADDVECQITDLKSLMALLAAFAGLAGFSGLGVFAIFAKIEVAQMLRACAILENMESEDVGEQVAEAQKKFIEEAKSAGCDLAKAAVLEQAVSAVFGHAAGELVGNADNFADALRRSLPCPPFTSFDTDKLC